MRDECSTRFMDHFFRTKCTHRHTHAWNDFMSLYCFVNVWITFSDARKENAIFCVFFGECLLKETKFSHTWILILKGENSLNECNADLKCWHDCALRLLDQYINSRFAVTFRGIVDKCHSLVFIPLCSKRMPHTTFKNSTWIVRQRNSSAIVFGTRVCWNTESKKKIRGNVKNEKSTVCAASRLKITYKHIFNMFTGCCGGLRWEIQSLKHFSTEYLFNKRATRKE